MEPDSASTSAANEAPPAKQKPMIESGSSGEFHEAMVSIM